jgi:hypothetical protein
MAGKSSAGCWLRHQQALLHQHPIADVNHAVNESAVIHSVAPDNPPGSNGMIDELFISLL